MIVGGGPAGVSTWLHLHKYNPELAAKTILIEKEKYPRDKLCGGALGEGTETILKKVDIELDVPTVTIHNVECKFGEETFHFKKENFFKIIRRKEFDHYLVKNALKRGLKLHENESFIDMINENGHLIVKTNKEDYRVKVLVGADGSLSKVRKKMNLSNTSNLATAIEFFSKVDPKRDIEFQNNTAIFDFTYISQGLQGYVWRFPCISDGEPSMNYGVGDFRFLPRDSKPDLKKILEKTLKNRNHTFESKSLKGAPIRLLSKDDIISRPNILLVGDAAGIDPVLGGGIQLSLLYGEVATQTIINAFDTGDFSFDNYRKRVDSHYLGKYIEHFSKLAYDLYDESKTVKSIQKIFGGKQ